METFFGLDQNSSAEYWRLCRQVVDGSAADDPEAWNRVLEAARSQHAGASNRGPDLIRIHRRATSRFAADFPPEKGLAVFNVWLSYAKMQTLYGTEKEARLTLRHIRNLKLGERQSTLYLAIAELERRNANIDEAFDALQTGIQKQAEPRSDLEEAMLELKSLTILQQQKSPNKRRLEPLVSPKRRKTESGFVNVYHTCQKDLIMNRLTKKGESPFDDNTDVGNMLLGPDGTSTAMFNHSKDSIRFQLAPLPRQSTVPQDVPRVTEPLPSVVNKSISLAISASVNKESQEVAHSQTELPQRIEGAKVDGSGEASKQTQNSNREDMLSQNSNFAISKSAGIKDVDITPRRTTLKTKYAKVTEQQSIGKVKTRRPPLLLSKTPRLARIGLGKVQRVDPSQPLDEDSGSDNDTAAPSGKQCTLKAPKMTKSDLTYMWEWDPTKKTGRVQSPSSKAINSLPCKETEEATSCSSNASGELNPSNNTVSCHGHDTNQSHTKDNGKDITSCPGKQQLPSSPLHEEKSLLASPSIAKVNPDFLPLVSEDNMLRVNGIPYAKLGVIGKGGSCKVYRALSKNCSVYAIKKVKLSGMDEKAIAGYSNEIALLKRLRDNPAIIQLLDSEVDLQRHAIFLVMEVGEVDLNHVLQQQAAAQTNGSCGDNKRTLNMNFIRLTWQQMLSAVHCIHEERIIHGDLKPANFLFVRGTLKLIDFGIAKAIQNDDTTNIYRESQIGTLNYMSPEAILDTGTGNSGTRIKTGRPSDIWSLGCILYQMIYGRTPFAELHMIQKLQAIVNPEHKISFPFCVDESAIDVMQSCLRRNPDERPPLVGEQGLLTGHRFLSCRNTKPM